MNTNFSPIITNFENDFLNKFILDQKLKTSIDKTYRLMEKCREKKQETKLNSVKKGSAGHRRCNCCGIYSPLGETILRKYRTQKRYRICIKCAGDFLL